MYVKKNILKENARKGLSVRHPKMCIRIVIEGLSHFGEKLAYNHKQISPFHYGSKETVHGDPKTLKEEVNDIKDTIKLLMK